MRLNTSCFLLKDNGADVSRNDWLSHTAALKCCSLLTTSCHHHSSLSFSLFIFSPRILSSCPECHPQHDLFSVWAPSFPLPFGLVLPTLTKKESSFFQVFLFNPSLYLPCGCSGLWPFSHLIDCSICSCSLCPFTSSFYLSYITYYPLPLLGLQSSITLTA